MSQANLTRVPETKPPAEEWERWEYLRDAPRGDAQDSLIRNIARQVWSIAGSWVQNDHHREQLLFCDLILTLVARGIEFGSDEAVYAQVEHIRGFNAPEVGVRSVLLRGADDCDEKARLAVALALAAGFNARMVPWWDATGNLVHVAAEVEIASETGGLEWVHLETILPRALAGELADEVPREEASGQWRR